MKLLEQRILKDGKVLPGGILKVDSFLNHQLDPKLMYEMALELKRLYDGEGINKILTIEASGIAIAIMVGLVFDCPVVFAKKSKTKNISDNVYSTEVESFTHGNTNTVVCSKEYLGASDRVLIVDDFLATGAALVGLKELVELSGGTVVGAGIAVEKVFQGGGELLKSKGMRVESLARIASMSDHSLEFVQDN
ncbi:MAG: xanthine phosphoribosyltransferase [Eubacteriales bacterium]|nr:xanthine phosphoribosyltransferase [Eubacteriales bacterium]